MAKLKVVALAEEVAQKNLGDFEQFKDLTLAALLAKCGIWSFQELRDLFVACEGDLANWEVPGLGWEPVTGIESDMLEKAIQEDPSLKAYFEEKISFSISSKAGFWLGKAGNILNQKVRK